jgi:hypothetical protein
MFEDLFFKSSNQAATAGTYSQASFFAFPFVSPSYCFVPQFSALIFILALI